MSGRDRPGCADAYSSLLLHAERYGVPARAVLRRCGEPALVGDQEGMPIDVAAMLAAER
ncbi:hypothetical protein [Amycolatopsis australiensis]|uniref:DmpG-like communication domain-containing protein n=1 Tax=Amycolatopsis australiensis TaxID=546364 RepID=A0A1K1SRC6_9PSEU|nr:hypothetical protein [Amycolatopsis australiensis]SFW86875.1 DmpG-like communication domain-containing protein [Amycolatopsis australiensis]